MNERSHPLLPVGLVASLLLALLAPAAAGAATTKDPVVLASIGTAWGSTAFKGNNLIAGRTAVSGLGCGELAGAHDANNSAGVNKPPLVTGATTTSVDATSNPRATTTISEVHGITINGGTVTADSVKSVSTTSFDGSQFSVSAAGSAAADLVVAGQHFSQLPPANTTVTTPDGPVVINEQKPTTPPLPGAKQAMFTVNMIHFYGNDGTQVIVAHATSGLRPPKAGILSGQAYVSRISGLGGAVLSGASALVIVPCHGTKGKVITNTVASSDNSGVTTDDGTTTAMGIANSTTAEAHTTATVHGAVVGNASTFSVDEVEAVANAFSDGTQNSDGSHFTNLIVAGQAFGDNVAPNTCQPLAGVGTMCLYKVVQTAHKIVVRMIDITVTEENPPGGLKTGSEIIIGAASAGVRPTR